MLFDLLIFGAGLLVGWNFLAQPEWVKTQVAKATGAVKKRLANH